MHNPQGDRPKTPSLRSSLLPLIALGLLLVAALSVLGSDAINGGNQFALLAATALCAAISIVRYGCSWGLLEDAMMDNIRASSPAIVILLLIGALSGSWMLSGVVPTMIYYGLKVLSPTIFLSSAAIICAIVSLMTGSSWTTIATIGVALMGIGTAQGFAEGWVAGAIISGAYFGDKLSMLSDTTVLASSTAEVPIFTHIKYMLHTTVPSFVLALVVFTIAGAMIERPESIDTALYSDTLEQTFHISPWLLLVPVATAFLIAKRLPAIVTLFCSAILASIAMLIAQPEIMLQLTGVEALDAASRFDAVVTAFSNPTQIITPTQQVNDLISTRGMEGMLTTIWLIICAMCFGGAMVGSGMLGRLTSLALKHIHGRRGAVGSTLSAGLFFNVTTADQYISIILTGRLFKGLYEKLGLEARLLSRSVEDAASVTSVLVPWNSCGMAQATVLGVSTLTYLPYAIFNIASPIVSFIVATIGYKIVMPRLESEKQNDTP